MCDLKELAGYLTEALVLVYVVGMVVGWAIGRHEKRAKQ